MLYGALKEEDQVQANPRCGVAAVAGRSDVSDHRQHLPQQHQRARQILRVPLRGERRADRSPTLVRSIIERTTTTRRAVLDDVLHATQRHVGVETAVLRT